MGIAIANRKDRCDFGALKPLSPSWNVLSGEPSGDRIARSCCHTVPDLTVKTEVKDRIATMLPVARQAPTKGC